MAADLFGNVTQTGAQLGGRRWHTLPLSILTHATVVAAIVVVPLANSELPPPIRRAIAQYSDIDITPVVPPPPSMRRASAPRAETPRVSPDAAPIEAPSGVAPESFADTLSDVGDVEGVPNGIPGGLPTESTLVPPLPAPVEAPRPIRITRGVTPPRRLVYVQPVYPPIAQANRVTGRVVIEAIIGPTGDVESTRVVQSTVRLLEDAALTAVRQWKYTPTLLSGVPVSVILTVSVDFTLAQ
jgi:periplasmic protein TonB